MPKEGCWGIHAEERASCAVWQRELFQFGPSLGAITACPFHHCRSTLRSGFEGVLHRKDGCRWTPEELKLYRGHQIALQAKREAERQLQGWSITVESIEQMLLPPPFL